MRANRSGSGHPGGWNRRPELEWPVPGASARSEPRLNDAGTSPLVERIEAFELDDPEASFPFTRRLALEQGWTHAYAGRVAREYKRFIALAATAGHPVSPSEAVDHAWHLHLVYTRSYWHELCRDVLGREIHHQPSRGGSEEGGKFGDWYVRTLESYRTIFGSEPPDDIWPPPGRHRPAIGRWVDRAAYWLIRKPRW